MMRGLLFDFPADQKALECDDEFMFGESLLVCPVTKPMDSDNSRKVQGKQVRACYLPKGCNWYSYWEDTLYEGGRTVNMEVKLDKIPLFVRAGSILLTQKPTMYAMEEAEALELRIYCGADCACVYYHDDGNSYAYEAGAYEEIRFLWSEEEQRLTIREVNRARTAPIRMVIYAHHSETIILYDGGAKSISF